MAPGEPSIILYDTTLRDGSQSEEVQFSAADKLKITKLLDEFGVDYIEGGWPGANPKDEEFFSRARGLRLKNSRLAAFGSTRRAGVKVNDDLVMQGLLKAETGVVTIFGKSWDLHVHRALEISLEENLELVHDSVEFLKQRVDKLFFDAEHFFDGYKANPEYALAVLRTALRAGADCLVLCDTNGGSMVEEIAAITARAATLGGELGIHCHDDCGLAVANTLAGVRAGALQVQGTINGLGERCGNADLVAVIPNLRLKLGYRMAITEAGLRKLAGLSRQVNELANRIPRNNQPFVGHSAFAHKGGIHVSAVVRESATYEHIVPELVGNKQRVLVSEQSGRSNLLVKLSDYGIANLDPHDHRLRKLLAEVKELEQRGYQFDGADASFEIRARRHFGQAPDYFRLEGFRVIDERRNRADSQQLVVSEATVKVVVAGKLHHVVGEGNGPVDALNRALFLALEPYYAASLTQMELVDYKVRILDSHGTGASVRVLIGWRDAEESWSTVGVSHHIIEASYDAIVDAVRFKLFRDGVAAPGDS